MRERKNLEKRKEKKKEEEKDKVEEILQKKLNQTGAKYLERKRVSFP